MKLLALADDRVVDGFQRAGVELTECFANPFCAEAGAVIPVTNAKPDAEGSMVLRLILKLVIITVAAQANRCQNDDLPIIQTWPTYIAARFFVDVIGDEIHDLTPKFTTCIDVLQSRRNGTNSSRHS